MNKKVQKPDKREYTIKIIPHHGETVRSVRLPMRTIRYGIAGVLSCAVVMVSVFCFSTYNASLVNQDRAELEELRQVNSLQQDQILSLSKKANTLQEDMNKLNELETEIRQIAAVDGGAHDTKPAAHDGQGGPGIQPNIQNLSEIMDDLGKNMTASKERMETLRSVLAVKKAQMAVTPSIWPAGGDVSSRYGLRWGGSDFHPGIDIANDTGTPVVATADGVVVSSAWNAGGYGYMVDIDHGNGIVTRYAHNAELGVSEGMTVKKGQVIAYMGSTGFSTGPHVHYEVIVNGKAVNPNRFL